MRIEDNQVESIVNFQRGRPHGGVPTNHNGFVGEAQRGLPEELLFRRKG